MSGVCAKPWLIAFPQVNANELTNGVINAAFMLLFKDSIRLFAAYNEGIINLLGKKKLLPPLQIVTPTFNPHLFHLIEKYFDMKKTQCKEGLDIYKKFLTRMTRISEFLKVAEVHWWFTGWLLALMQDGGKKTTNLAYSVLKQQVGIDRGDIPDLSQVSLQASRALSLYHCLSCLVSFSLSLCLYVSPSLF